MDQQKIDQQRDEYVEFLRSDAWEKKKQAVRARARKLTGGSYLVCEICKTDNPDNGRDRSRGFWQTAHVRGYKGKLEDTPISDLRNVCRDCHERLHGYRPPKASDNFYLGWQRANLPTADEIAEIIAGSQLN